MNKLERLIDELCPDGVEYKTLGDIGEIKTGSKPTIISEQNGKYVYINAGTTNSGFVDEYNMEGDVVTTPSRGQGGIGFVGYQKNKFWLGPLCYRIKAKNCKEIINKYLYYYLLHNNEAIFKIKNKGGVPSVNKIDLEKILIEVPPLPVQEEIVRILDTFTELTAELTAELTMRKQQYEYFETTLLFDSKYPRVLLKDVCTVNQGLQIPINQRKTENGENRYFYITVQFLKGDNEDKYYIENPNESVICNLDDVLVTRTGSTGKIITGVHGCFHNNFFKVNCFNTINKRYMYYFLNSQVMFRKLLHTASGGTVPDLPHNKFYKLEIPLPSLEEQQRIVDILDRFDTLVNDIKTGLPAEIEARQKQYEYYRDKLLTFKKLEK